MFRIPRITKYLLLINIGVFLLTMLLLPSSRSAGAGTDLNSIFGLHFFLAPDFHFFQLFTYMFMHANWGHLFFNMFALWMFGCVVENTLGQQRFLLFYLLCGIGAGLFQEAAQVGEFIVTCRSQIPQFHLAELLVVARNSAATLNLWTTVGASGAIYGILLAFGMLYPEQHIFIFPLPIPIKAKWFVIIYVAIELFSALGTTRDGVAHVAHLGGMLIGYLLIRYWRRHPYGSSFGGGTHSIFSDRRSAWQQRGGTTWRHPTARPPFTTTTTTTSADKQSDWDYNAQQAARQKEIDAILDKIRKNGYDSLTTEEKQTLFDSSRN